MTVTGRPRLPADPVPAVSLLRGWLEVAEVSQVDLARRLECHVSLVRQWLSGAKRPSYEMAAALERVSDGAVPLGSWANPVTL